MTGRGDHPPLRAAVEQLGTSRIATLRGRLDADGVRRLGRSLDAGGWRPCELLALDVAAVQGADVAGARALAKLVARIERGGPHVVVVGPSPELLEHLERAGVRDRLALALVRASSETQIRSRSR